MSISSVWEWDVMLSGFVEDGGEADTAFQMPMQFDFGETLVLCARGGAGIGYELVEFGERSFHR